MIGFHASHEQFAPACLLALARRAVDSGFDAVMCSDHFHPWSRRQGQSGQAWAWAGALLGQVPVSLGMVTCPSGRYHPAVVAQAVATLEQFAPTLVWLAVGSGEALNEAITGQPWPSKDIRNARLRASAEVIRRLWAGDKVSLDGEQGVQVREARLYSRPATPIPLLGAALTPETAHWLGGWADGLITTSMPMDELRAVVRAFEAGGGAGKPMYLQVKLSYARSYDAALAGAREQWRQNVLSAEQSEQLSQPEAYEQLGHQVSDERLTERVIVSHDPGVHREALQGYLDMGFQRLYLHNVNLEQERFIDDFATRVLPTLQLPPLSTSSQA